MGGSGTGSSSPASPAASAASVAAAAELPAPEASEPAPSPGGGGTSMAQRGPLLTCAREAVFLYIKKCIIILPLVFCIPTKSGHLVYCVLYVLIIQNTNNTYYVLYNPVLGSGILIEKD